MHEYKKNILISINAAVSHSYIIIVHLCLVVIISHTTRSEIFEMKNADVMFEKYFIIKRKKLKKSKELTTAHFNRRLLMLWTNGQL